MAGNSAVSEFIFCENLDTIGDSEIFVIDGRCNTINLEFVSTGTFTANIMAQLIDTAKWYPYPSFKLPVYDLMSDDITDGNYLYNVDVTGISKIKIVISSVSDTLSVYGKGVG